MPGVSKVVLPDPNVNVYETAIEWAIGQGESKTFSHCRALAESAQFLDPDLEADLPRTYVLSTDGDLDEPASENLRVRVRTILGAYLVRNPAIRYGQGMNKMVSALLQSTTLSDEQVFYVFGFLLETVLVGYFELPDMYSAFRDDVRRILILLNR